jgi:hypothetical protein
MEKLVKGLKTPSITVLAAAPGGGKTHLIRWLICEWSRLGRFSYGWVFSPTAFNGSYNWLPEANRSEVYTDKALQGIIDHQKTYRNPAFLILDDCMGSINFLNALWTNFITTFRHYNLTLLIASQYILKIPPVMRQCVTYAIVFKQNQKRSLVALHENFFVEMDNWQEVRRFIDRNAVGYKFILVRCLDSVKRYTLSQAPSKPCDIVLGC